MNIPTLGQCEDLNNMMQSDGWKILVSYSEDILNNLQREVISKDRTTEMREKLVQEYHNLKDFMKMPRTLVQMYVIAEKNKERKKQSSDPYETVEIMREREKDMYAQSPSSEA